MNGREFLGRQDGEEEFSNRWRIRAVLPTKTEKSKNQNREKEAAYIGTVYILYVLSLELKNPHVSLKTSHIVLCYSAAKTGDRLLLARTTRIGRFRRLKKK